MSTTEARSYAHAHVNQDWLDRVQEPILDPGLPIEYELTRSTAS